MDADTLALAKENRDYRIAEDKRIESLLREELGDAAYEQTVNETTSVQKSLAEKAKAILVHITSNDQTLDKQAWEKLVAATDLPDETKGELSGRDTREKVEEFFRKEVTAADGRRIDPLYNQLERSDD